MAQCTQYAYNMDDTTLRYHSGAPLLDAPLSATATRRHVVDDHTDTWEAIGALASPATGDHNSPGCRTVRTSDCPRATWTHNGAGLWFGNDMPPEDRLGRPRYPNTGSRLQETLQSNEGERGVIKRWPRVTHHARARGGKATRGRALSVQRAPNPSKCGAAQEGSQAPVRGPKAGPLIAKTPP